VTISENMVQKSLELACGRNWKSLEKSVKENLECYIQGLTINAGEGSEN
jgi:hypothetical protein